jgi:ribosomal protein S18 acetylase RimI-like enzyme
MLAIRSAAADEVPQIVNLWEREGGPTRHAGRQREAARLLQRDPGALLVADNDGAIVGSLIVGWDGWRCHMYRLVVEPGLRRRGVGRALVEEAQRRAKKHGAVRMDAMIDADNVEAISFWESLGFELDFHSRRWSLLF